jgi:hypothetical protein
VLQDDSLQVTQDKCVAVIGASVLDKSVTALLQLPHKPASARITISNTELCSINIGYLCEHMSVVSQNPHLFDVTITKNIIYRLCTQVHHRPAPRVQDDGGGECGADIGQAGTVAAYRSHAGFSSWVHIRSGHSELCGCDEDAAEHKQGSGDNHGDAQDGGIVHEQPHVSRAWRQSHGERDI